MIDNDWWNNIKPDQSYSKVSPQFRPEPLDYNLIIEYPVNMVSKTEIKEFLEKILF